MPGYAAFSSRWWLAALCVAILPSAAWATTIDDRARLALLAREDLRIATIAYRLQRAATADCADKAGATGLVLHDLAQYAPSVRGDAKRLFGLSAQVTVLAVVSGSPADKAGLRPGDALLAVGAITLPAVTLDQTGSAAVRDAALAIAKASAGGALSLMILRTGQTQRLSFPVESACAGRIQLVPSTRLEASSAAKLVTVTTAITEYLDRDDDLAFVLAHELAHIALRHRPQGGALGLGGAAARTQESAADRLGLRIVSRAGYDPRAAAEAIARLARARGQRFRFDPGHPPLDRRLAVLREEATMMTKGTPYGTAEPNSPVNYESRRRWFALRGK